MMREKITSLFNTGDRVFKTDTRYLTRGGFWLSFGHVASLFFSFLLSIAFANLLSPETYGTYRYILTLGGIAGIASLGGLGAALSRAAAQGYDATFKKIVGTNLRWGLITSLIAFLGAGYYFINDNETLGLGLVIVGIFSPILDTFELYSSYLSGKKQFSLNAGFKIARSLFAMCCMIAVLLFIDDPVVIILFYFIIHTIATGMAYAATRIICKPVGGGIDPEAISLGKHLSLMHMFAALSERIDNVLVFHYLGPVQLAMYNFALLIPNHISGLIKNVGTLALPKFVAQEKELVKKTMIRKSLMLLIATLPIFILYIFFAPALFRLVFPQYTGSIFFTQVYAFSILVSGILPLTFLDAHVALKEKYILNIVSNTFKIGALLAGVLLYGLLGLIIARIASKLLGVILVFFLIRKV